MLSSRAAAPPPAAAPVAAALVAHGQVVPVQQARVGTLGGGQVQQLEASLGAEVSAQTPLAWVIGPSGTEVVTAPFSGSVTNVLVHAGDTLMPGATIAVVANMHSLQVETSDVDEFLVGHVSVGQRVQVTVDALDNLALTGHRHQRCAATPDRHQRQPGLPGDRQPERRPPGRPRRYVHPHDPARLNASWQDTLTGVSLTEQQRAFLEQNHGAAMITLGRTAPRRGADWRRPG